MPITIQLPPSLEDSLRRALPNFDEQAKEHLLVSLYREGKITHHEFATALAISRFDADGVLKRHQVIEDLMTAEEFDEERALMHKPPKS